MDCTSGSRTFRRLSAWITGLRKVNATGSYAKWDPCRNGAVHISPRYTSPILFSFTAVQGD